MKNYDESYIAYFYEDRLEQFGKIKIKVECRDYIRFKKICDHIKAFEDLKER